MFRDWPYLYDGTLEYEEKYLNTFAAAKGAVVICAYDGADMVGASTGAPMIEHADEFGEPFRKAGYDLSKIFYCGESVLLKSHRGYGLGHAFFDGRERRHENSAASNNRPSAALSVLTTILLKPKDYLPLDPFWTKRGYAPVPGLIATYDWKDIDHDTETTHQMQFWMKTL